MDTAVKPVQTGRRSLEGGIIAYGPEQWLLLIPILAVLTEALPAE